MRTPTSLLGLAILLGVAPGTILAQQVRVEHAPEQAASTSPHDEGMILYTDPETGQITAKAPPGAQIDFPEFQSRADAVTEETRSDGSTLTRLNGQGMEAQILRTDADGQPRITCTSVIESALPSAGSAGDLRRRTTRSKPEVRHDR